MKSGMLWFDADPKTSLETKVRQAMAFYQNKYQQAPDTCLVNPVWTVQIKKIDGITVIPDKEVLPNHLIIGVETSEKKTGTPTPSQAALPF